MRFGLPVFEFFATVAFLLDLDRTLAIFSFSDLLTMLSRFRFINMNYGSILEGYFKESGSRIEKYPYFLDKKISEISNGTKNKFSLYELPLTILNTDCLLVAFYAVSWLFKFSFYLFLTVTKRLKRISKCPYLFYRY